MLLAALLGLIGLGVWTLTRNSNQLPPYHDHAANDETASAQQLTSMKYADQPNNRYFNDLMEDEMTYYNQDRHRESKDIGSNNNPDDVWRDLGLSEKEYEDYLDSTDGGREDEFGFFEHQDHYDDEFSKYDDYDDDEEW